MPGCGHSKPGATANLDSKTALSVKMENGQYSYRVSEYRECWQQLKSASISSILHHAPQRKEVGFSGWKILSGGSQCATDAARI